MNKQKPPKAVNYLTKHYNPRYNILTNKTEIRSVTGSDYVEMDDYTLNSIYFELREMKIKCSTGELRAIFESKYTKPYDPFPEYFDSLQAHDDNDSIGQLIRTVKLADESESRWFHKAFRIFMRAVVACAKDSKPNHQVLVLVGPQGTFKTTFLNNLCPEALRSKYFQTTFNHSDKDSLIAMSNNILISLDELASFGRSSMEAFKAKTSLKDINVRKPYSRFNCNFRRTASFVGSSNKINFLNDTTGSRRFLIFEIEAVDWERAKLVSIDKVYAQAYHEYTSGEQFYFTNDYNKIIERSNQRFQEISKIEELLLERFKVPQSNDEKLEMTPTEIAYDIFEGSKTPSEQDVRKTGQYLSKHAFSQKLKRQNNRPQRLWAVCRV